MSLWPLAIGSVDSAAWWRVFEGVLERIGGRFARSGPHRTVRELLLGLLAPIERKNGWWLASTPASDLRQIA